MQAYTEYSGLGFGTRMDAMKLSNLMLAGAMAGVMGLTANGALAQGDGVVGCWTHGTQTQQNVCFGGSGNGLYLLVWGKGRCGGNAYINDNLEALVSQRTQQLEEARNAAEEAREAAEEKMSIHAEYVQQLTNSTPILYVREGGGYEYSEYCWSAGR